MLEGSQSRYPDAAGILDQAAAAVGMVIVPPAGKQSPRFKRRLAIWDDGDLASLITGA